MSMLWFPLRKCVSAVLMQIICFTVELSYKFTGKLLCFMSTFWKQKMLSCHQRIINEFGLNQQKKITQEPALFPGISTRTLKHLLRQLVQGFECLEHVAHFRAEHAITRKWWGVDNSLSSLLMLILPILLWLIYGGQTWDRSRSPPTTKECSAGVFKSPLLTLTRKGCQLNREHKEENEVSKAQKMGRIP